jgi:RimJ/RimL family protein N-acetyltransferase
VTDVLSLVDLPVDALRALAAGDVAEASAVVGLDVPAVLLDDGVPWDVFAERRARPGAAGWTIQLAVEDGVVVGHGGFHEPPGPEGDVEIGYTVVPAARGRGVATGLVGLLVVRAREADAVRVVRGCTAPGNVVSQAVLRHHGFVLVGEAMDEVDGLELVHELAVG